MRIIRYTNSMNEIQFAALNPDGSAARIVGDADQFKLTDEAADISRLLAPVEPPAIFAVGLNYADHAEELGLELSDYPVVFMLSPTAIQHPNAPIYLPRHLPSDEVDYEGELGVVIRRQCKNVSKEEALDYVLGYTCANDVSARDWQFKWGGGQFSRSKTFDTFCPIGPCMATPETIEDPGRLQLRTILNDKVMQNTNTGHMHFSVAEIISFLSGSTTLLPGTLILTGTPAGIGISQKPPVFLQPDDSVSVEIDAIGTLFNPVHEEPLEE